MSEFAKARGYMGKKLFRMTGLSALGLALGCNGQMPEPGGGNAAAVSVTFRRDAAEAERVSPDVGQGAASSAAPGVIRGRISFSGNAIELKALVEKGASKVDPTVCAKDGAIADERLIVGANKGIANFFVYLDAPPLGGRPLSANESGADQKACVFKPHALVVGVGEVELRNSDTVAHNVQTMSQRNSSINVNLDPGKQYVTKFKKPEKEPFAAKCAIHPWMSFYTLVLDHPYGVITDAEGSFELKDVPVGKYKVRLWHEAAGKVIENVTVEVKSGAATEINKEFSGAQLGLGG